MIDRYNSIGSWLKKKYGCKVVKLSLDGGFTCPNRDGSKGTGGCLFCSEEGSGEHSSSFLDLGEIPHAMAEQVRLLSDKWPESKYIAYFQSFTSTYASVSRLRALYEEALKQPGVVGLAIATRPDCLDDDVLDLLEELKDKTFLWVELGLQTIHRQTMENMNLCYTLEDYDNAIKNLNERGIFTVTHLILGLPGETREMMLDSVRYVCGSGSGSDSKFRPCLKGKDPRVFGIKLHMLNVVKDTALAAAYPDYVPFETMEDYADLVIDALELIPPEVTIHRIYAEAPKNRLIAPSWAREKRKALNKITRRMKERDSRQGSCLSSVLS